MFDVFYFDQKPNLFAHEQQVKSIEEAIRLSRTRFFWIVNYLCNYQDFDFLWEPKPWEANQKHVWPSQWQVDSGTWLIPTDGYTDTNYLNKSSIIRRSFHDTVVIDHGNLDTNLELPNDLQIIKKMRYVENYQQTLIRIANTVEAEYVWVVSSICNYRYFNFTWHPDPWQQELLHVFATDDLAMGDTFLMHVPTARQKLPKVEILDWYDLNYVKFSAQLGEIRRLAPPETRHFEDSHVDMVARHTFNWPYEVFTNAYEYVHLPTPCLWRDAYKQIYPLSRGASSVLVPREAQAQIKTQLYDYPFISADNMTYNVDKVLPIIFVSNGEPCAEENWHHLNNVVKGYRHIFWIDGVTGRVASQHSAADKVPETDWYFFVPAKLQISKEFDWQWQPDRMQQPKHYVFHAYNPVNELSYGHMAMVCYNRKLVLATQGTGLDFTLEQPHSIVPTISGVATYDCDPKTAWRTAFRETVKLKHYQCIRPDIETSFRLERWLEVGKGNFGMYSQLGAQAGVDYYDSVKGDFAELKKTYDWKFLDELWNQTSPHLSLK